MTIVTLRLPDYVHKDLWKHLLPDQATKEEAAFAFVKPQQSDRGLEFEFVELLKLTDQHFAQKLGDYLELDDEVRARVIKRAHDLDASIVEFHSHPGPWPAMFSEADRIGLEEFVPHVWWRLKGKPYAAIVVAPSGFDGLVWADAPTVARPLDEVNVDGRVYEPTRLTLPRWRARMERFDRSVRFFGRDGQERLARSRVVVVGAGGIGTYVIEEIAQLGVGRIGVVDDEVLDRTNLNRYAGVRHDDVGKPKVELSKRRIHEIDPTIQVDAVKQNLRSAEAFDLIKAADYVFGCVDNDGARLILNELCAAYEIPYIDLASDVEPGPTPSYGGRICVAHDRNGCIVCLGAIDIQEALYELDTPESRENRGAVYGIRKELLEAAGPSVNFINGMVASFGVGEFFVMVTGMRAPNRLINCYGHLGRAAVNTDPPSDDCYYCKHIRGLREKAEVERYIRVDNEPRRRSSELKEMVGAAGFEPATSRV